jgi:tetratricopeptide (TPR) repeat protein
LALPLLLLLVPSVLAGGSPQQLLDEAVREYRAALDCHDREQRIATFRRAELLLARLAEGDQDGADGADGAIHNADLYVNLGNAALGAERLGPAILAYRRALALDPDHHRARQNLLHARTLLPDWVPRPSEGGLLDTFFAWRHRLTAGQMRLVAAAAFLIAAALLACAIRWRQTMFRNLAVIPASVWLLLLSLMLLGGPARSGQAAVVILPEVVARSADSAGAPPRLPQPLPGGTELEVLETRDRWTRVRLFDSREAWVPESALGWVGQKGEG